MRNSPPCGGRRRWCAAPGTSFGTSWGLRRRCTPSAGGASPTRSGDRAGRGRRGKLAPASGEMTAEGEMAARELDALDLATSNEIGRILATLGNRAAVAVLYRTTLIPQAEQSFRANVESYEVGKIDFPMLMDSVMTVLSFRKEYSGMVGEMHMEKARLEAAVGRELN